MFSSPTFTGTPIAPTAADGTNSQQLATTAFMYSSLKGYKVSTAGTTDVWGTIPTIGSTDGVMEVGKHIDFHIIDGSTVDNDVRLTATAGNISCSGTLTATGFIGNASSSTKLATARKINGVYFDGTTDITITAYPNAHTNDDRYYTETEIDNKFNTLNGFVVSATLPDVSVRDANTMYFKVTGWQ